MERIRVALVEDHDLTRAGLRVALSQCRDVQLVGEAGNGQDGLQMLENTIPDLAIIDIGLPKIDGIELTRQFKQFLQNRTPPVPEPESAAVGSTTPGSPSPSTGSKVLMLTMQDDESAVLAAFAAGADSYCMKDASMDKLLEALRLTTEGQNWIDPAIARIILQQVHWQQSPKDDPAANQKMVAIQGVDADQDQLMAADPLTERELEVLALIVKGCSNAAIADQLYITVGTVKTHVRNILNKLSADDRTQAAVLALRSGLIA
jgi:two-component system, NarL family, response regulator LiaR